MSTRHGHSVPVVFEGLEKHDSVAALSESGSKSANADTNITWVGSSPSPKRAIIGPRQIVIVCGIGGMLGWLYVFGVGILVNSKPYRDQLASSFNLEILAKALLTFTPTNVALLAMLAGFIGGCASLLMYSDYDPSAVGKQNGKPPMDQERLAYLRENPISSALRGFVVYLTFLAGTVFGASGAFSSTTQDQYCRLAGAVAVLAFGVGYDPTVFRQVLSLVTRGASGGAKPKPDDRLPVVAPGK